MEYYFSILFNSKPGFVIRVALILERRGFEIQSLTIQHHQESVAEMILKVSGVEEKKDQVIKQISKLIDVLEVSEVNELVLDKVGV